MRNSRCTIDNRVTVYIIPASPECRVSTGWQKSQTFACCLPGALMIPWHCRVIQCQLGSGL